MSMVRLTHSPLDPERISAKVRKDTNGAVVTFLGTTRNNFEGKLVLSLEYEAFEEMAKQYPDVATHHELVDAACMKFVQAPWAFDVVVASNLQGDILTDLAAVLSGGMGVAPSCNLNPDENGMPSMFEPTHGSAPDIAGQGLADPTAMLFTTARMLEWLGRKDPAVAAAGRELFDAVAADLAENAGKSRGTQEIGAAVRERLESLTRP